MDVITRILEEKIIAILRGISAEYMLSAAEALRKGGITCLEIALDHRSEKAAEEACEALRRLDAAFGQKLCIGAGTVLSAEEVRRCAHAGAKYIISPNVRADVIAETKKLGLVSIPGAYTPTEIIAAHEAGADIVKLFPVGEMGVSYIKALRGPLGHIRLAAVGGITPENCASFQQAGCCCIGVGSSLVDRETAENGDWDKITGTAEKYREAMGMSVPSTARNRMIGGNERQK